MGLFPLPIILCIGIVLFIIPKTVDAIVILPPIIIVSVVQIVVGVIAFLTAPTSVISGIIIYLKKPKNRRQFIVRTAIATIMIVGLLSVFAVVVAKILHPDRPWI